MDITFKSRHTSVPERFRRHAAAKLSKLEKLDQKAIRIDVEVSKERNPRQSDRSERVELTIRSKGPTIRAEAAADDRYVALDLAFAKVEARLRRASERRKPRRAEASVRSVDAPSAVAASPTGQLAAGAATGTTPSADEAAAPAGVPPAGIAAAGRTGGRRSRGMNAGRPETLVPLPDMPDGGGYDYANADEAEQDASGLVPIQMEGDGPLVVREKFHSSHPMTIDQALFEMELVGHAFFAYHDSQCGKFSVVYRRRGYDYGVIRLVEE